MIQQRILFSSPSRVIAIFIGLFIILTLPGNLYADKKNILDYYHLLPGDYFSIDPNIDSNRYRNKIIEVNSVNTGYLKIRVPDVFGWYELGIFRDKKLVRDVIFLNFVGCGPGCRTGKFDILVYNQNTKEFADISKEIFPALPPDILADGYVLEIPRYGTTLRFFLAGEDGVGKKLPYVMHWGNGRFDLKKEGR